MEEKEQPKTEKPNRNHIPQKGQGDYFEKGQQGIIPPKPQPEWPKESESNEGVPGWTPPNNDE